MNGDVSGWPRLPDYERVLLAAERAERTTGILHPDLENWQAERRRPGVESLKFRVGWAGGVVRFFDEDTSIAVKVFIRNLDRVEERYGRLQAWLADRSLNALVDEFSYQPEGVFVGDRMWPVLTMSWCEGKQIDTYLDERLRNRSGGVNNRRLVDAWLNVVDELRANRIAHGDLQHGNILVDPETVAMSLVDYDVMFVPTMQGWKAGEFGHPDYQHPARSEAEIPYDEHLDSFSALLIMANLHCVDRELWSERSPSEGLLTHHEDLKDPDNSVMLPRMRRSTPTAEEVVGALLAAIDDPNTSHANLLRAAEAIGRPLTGEPLVADSGAPARLPEAEQEEPEPTESHRPDEKEHVVPEPAESFEPGGRDEPGLDAETLLGVVLASWTPTQRDYLRFALAASEPKAVAERLDVTEQTARRGIRRELDRADIDPARVEEVAKALRFGGMSDRQREILDLLNEGLRPDAVAERLHVTERTIRRHVSRMGKSLLASPKPEDVVRAARLLGIVSEPAIGVESSDPVVQPELLPEALNYALAAIFFLGLAIAGIGLADLAGFESLVARSVPGGYVTPLVAGISLAVTAFAALVVVEFVDGERRATANAKRAQ